MLCWLFAVCFPTQPRYLISLLCTSHWKPPHPPIGGYLGHSLLLSVKASKSPTPWEQNAR